MKKKITLERWCNPRELMLEDYSTTLETDSNAGNLTKCEVTVEVDMYNIKIIKGLNGCHLVNDSKVGRLPYDQFMFLLKRLRRCGQCVCEWNIYPGQPVWEFNWSEGTLGHQIREINPLINVEYV